MHDRVALEVDHVQLRRASGRSRRASVAPVSSASSRPPRAERDAVHVTKRCFASVGSSALTSSSGNGTSSPSISSAKVDRRRHRIEARKAQEDAAVAGRRDPRRPVVGELRHDFRAGPRRSTRSCERPCALVPIRAGARRGARCRARTRRPRHVLGVGRRPGRRGAARSARRVGPSVAACVADVGRRRSCCGSAPSRRPVFLRSSAKPFIAAAAVRAGVLERFGFGERELARDVRLAQRRAGHVELVASMLERIGASVDDLRCGAHPPSYEPAAAALAARGERPTQLHNNCSGKHAGILALAKVLGAPFEGYLEPGASGAARDPRAVRARQRRRVRRRQARGRRLRDPGLRDDAAQGRGLVRAPRDARRASTTTTRRRWRASRAAMATRAVVRRRHRPLRHRPACAPRSGRIVCKGRRRRRPLRRAPRRRARARAQGRRRDAPRRGAGDARVLDALHALEPAAREALRPHAVVPVKNVAGRVVGEVAALDGWIRPRSSRPAGASNPCAGATVEVAVIDFFLQAADLRVGRSRWSSCCSGSSRSRRCRSRSSRTSRRRRSRSPRSITGASAEAVESSVTTPLEQAINGVQGLRYISSQSRQRRHLADHRARSTSTAASIRRRTTCRTRSTSRKGGCPTRSSRSASRSPRTPARSSWRSASRRPTRAGTRST